MSTGDKYFINGRWWYEDNITIEIKGVPIIGIKAISFDSKGNRIEENITNEEADKRILNNKK